MTELDFRKTLPNLHSMERMVAKAPLLLLLIGLALFVSGLVMPQYRNAEEYRQRYWALEGPTRSEAFFELRKQSLTPSLKLQDYGLTSVFLGMVMFTILHRSSITTLLPKKKATAALLGGIAAFATVGAQVGSLFLNFKRGDYPHWADSLGIPLCGMPIMLGMLLLWAVIHSLLMPGKNAEFHCLARRIKQGWLVLMIILSSVILLTSALYGDFWQIPPAGLWILFYAALWLGMKFSETEPLPLK